MKPVVIIQNCELESAGTIEDYLKDRHIPFTTVHSYRGDPMPNPDANYTLIVLGTPVSVTAYHRHDYLVALFGLLGKRIRINAPILGICFGAQFLAHALGAKVSANNVKEIGTYTVSLTDQGARDALYKGFDSDFPVFQWHGDTFRIPFDADHLATSTDCRNQVFRKGALVGVQFHLEADIRELPTWCDAYASELAEVGKSKETVLAEYEAVAANVRENNFCFLDNYFSLID
jgi:GMP synthase (glutamine-hydrolysing)